MAKSGAKINEKQLSAELRLQLARKIADGEVPDDVVRSVTKELVSIQEQVGEPIRRFDVCVYGICLDYFVDNQRFADLLGEVVRTGPRVRDIRVFPWGIIENDLLQITVEHQFDELAPHVRGPGL